MRFINKIIVRVRSYFIRRKKANDIAGWIKRWDFACANSWRFLNTSEPSAENFNRWERNHERLMRLMEAKNKIFSDSRK